MSVLNHYNEEDLETALIVAWVVRDNIKLAILQGDEGTLKYGICSEWEDLLDGWERKVTIICIRDDLYHSWPQFSGSSWYPIPMPDLDEDDYANYAEDYISDNDGDDFDMMSRAQWIYEQVGNMWDGEYGALRMDCLDWMIETLEAAVL